MFELPLSLFERRHFYRSELRESWSRRHSRCFCGSCSGGSRFRRASVKAPLPTIWPA